MGEVIRITIQFTPQRDVCETSVQQKHYAYSLTPDNLTQNV